jgi:hypothetical protein
MRFSYSPIRTVAPVPSIGGRTARPPPIVCVTVVGPSDSQPIDAIIDSASDETLFDESVAKTIGINLSQSPLAGVSGIVGQSATAQCAQVTLRLTDGIEFREWPAWVGFIASLRRPVLGFGGCLQFFTTTLYGDDEVVELEINRLYPGI